LQSRGGPYIVITYSPSQVFALGMVNNLKYVVATVLDG
jgi:hypothetical protein